MSVVFFTCLLVLAFGGFVLIGLSFEPRLAGALGRCSEETALAVFLTASLLLFGCASAFALV